MLSVGIVDIHLQRVWCSITCFVILSCDLLDALTATRCPAQSVTLSQSFTLTFSSAPFPTPVIVKGVYEIIQILKRLRHTSIASSLVHNIGRLVTMTSDSSIHAVAGAAGGILAMTVT